MGLGFDIHFMFEAAKESVKYAPVTLLLAFVPFAAGILLGTLIALARLYRVKVLGKLFQAYVVIIRGIPVVLQILMAYYLLVQIFDGFAEALRISIRARDVDVIYIAFAALTVFGTASISEAIRGALMSVDKGQYEAAYSAGMTGVQTLKRIILPQALPVAVPMLCGSLIGLVKASSLVFMISVKDLMNAALIPANTNYKYLEAYVGAALVYWVINIMIERFSFILEKRLGVYRKGVTV